MFPVEIEDEIFRGAPYRFQAATSRYHKQQADERKFQEQLLKPITVDSLAEYMETTWDRDNRSAAPKFFAVRCGKTFTVYELGFYSLRDSLEGLIVRYSSNENKEWEGREYAGINFRYLDELKWILIDAGKLTCYASDMKTINDDNFDYENADLEIRGIIDAEYFWTSQTVRGIYKLRCEQLNLDPNIYLEKAVAAYMTFVVETLADTELVKYLQYV